MSEHNVMQNLLRTLAAILFALSLASCISTKTDKLEDVSKQYSRLSTLDRFGSAGGQIVLGYVNTWRDHTIQIPQAPPTISKHDETLSDDVNFLYSYYEPSQIDPQKWVSPEIEIGALYYVPRRFAGENDFLVVQKLCGIEKGHNLGTISIIDEDAPQLGRLGKWRIALSGEVAQDLLSSLTIFPIGLSANSEYIFEVELNDVRRRYMSPANAMVAIDRIVNGPNCRDKYLPMAKDNKILFLQEMYYGYMKVYQVGVVEGSADAKLIKLSGNYETTSEEKFFIAFKWFQEIDVDQFIRKE